MGVLKIIGLSIAGLLILLIIFNLIGRSHFNPRGTISKVNKPTNLESGKNSIEFLSHGDKIAGDLYLPDSFNINEKYPSIILMPPHSGVKEQTAGIYAEKLSKKGYLTLVFDPRGFGESTGHRGLMSPWRMIEDQKNAVDFVNSFEFVDKTNIFNLGICAGAGVAADATIEDSRIKAEILVTPYLTSSEEGTGGSAIMEQVLKTVGGVVRVAYKLFGNEMTTQPVPHAVDENSGGVIPVSPIVLGMMTYYLPGKPGDTPTWKNLVSLNSISAGLDYAIYDRANKIKKPTYMVLGTEAVSLEGAERLYDQIKGPKEKLVLEGAGHFEIYWKPKYVNPAVEGISNFLNQQVNSK
ncbi:MAG: alpha/beta hydrolase [Saprospiraceae bacterium]